MTPTLRAALAGCAALALVAGLASPALSQSAKPEWAQAHSDIRPDGAVRFGQLPNGMRYALVHNTTPPHQTSIRLRIGSGAFEETDAQQGLAHFLEHMAFKGSAHVPEGEMVKLLQRHGLAFGPDTNASTGFTETIYMLDLPESDQESLDLGLMLMRETASELNLDAKAMEPERGVVLSEERLRGTPGYEAAHKRQAFLMKGQLAPNRWPIGKVDVIRNAPASELRAYYQANYRPERATLVMVGNFDVDAIEAKIKSTFGDWRGVGPAVGEPVYGPVASRGLEALEVVQPGVSTSVSVDWTAAHDPSPDTRAKEARDYVEQLGMAIVNRRLERAARSDTPPFLAAVVGRSDQLRSIRIASMSVTPKGGDWRTALIAADGVRRATLQYGVQADELAYEISNMRTRLKGQVSAAATRLTPVIANQIVGTVDAEEVYNTPRDNLSIFEEAVRGLTPAQVDTVLKAAFEGGGPLVSMVTPTPLAGGESALLAGFAAAEAAPIAPPTAEVVKAWPYAHFGAPGQVVDRRSVPDLGVTYVTFANGVRLTFKQTAFRKDQVLVSYEMPGGLLALPTDHPTAVWATPVLPLGGTRQLTVEEAEKVLVGKIYNASARTSEEYYVLSGQTRTADVDTEMQVLTAYLTEPGWRPSALERLRSIASLQLDQIDSTPEGVLGRKLESLLHSGDPRWTTPTKADVQRASMSDLRAIWDKPLGQGPVDVVIIGDISLDRAIEAVANTVGSLPPRAPKAPVSATARAIHFPAATADPVRLTHKGRADQAVAYIAWPTNDFYANQQESRAVALATAVFQDRLIARVRIAEGATYSPSASDRASETFPGYGMISASVETPPDKLNGFFAAAAAIADDMREHPISADELERARKPRVEQIQKSKQNNEYWMGRLSGSIDDPRRLEVARTSIASYQAVSIADIQAVARKYMRSDTAFKLVVTPEAGATKP